MSDTVEFQLFTNLLRFTLLRFYAFTLLRTDNETKSDAVTYSLITKLI